MKRNKKYKKQLPEIKRTRKKETNHIKKNTDVYILKETLPIEDDMLDIILIATERSGIPFPMGNQYWKLRGTSGRSKLFESPAFFLELALGYFGWVDNNPWKIKTALKSGDSAGTVMDVPTQRPYTIAGLCIHLGITTQTFRNYEKNSAYEEFFAVFRFIKDLISNNQLEGAVVGAYNANIIARTLGLVDKQDIKAEITPKKEDLSTLSNEELIQRAKTIKVITDGKE